MIEGSGSGSGSIPTSGSGSRSRRPKTYGSGGSGSVLSATLIGPIQPSLQYERQVLYREPDVSPSLCSAFTCGSAFQVLTSQVQHVLGLSLPNYLGPGTLVKIYIGIGRQNTHSSLAVQTEFALYVIVCWCTFCVAKMNRYRPGTLVKIYIGIGRQQKYTFMHKQYKQNLHYIIICNVYWCFLLY